MPATAVPEYVAALRREGAMIAAAAARVGLDTRVPSCPDWPLRELVQHAGRTHLWAAANVAQPRSEPLTADEEQAVWGTMPDDASTPGWYADTVATVARVLDEAAPDVACWSFLPAPSPLAFWARRQAHEAAIHRVDAQLAVETVTGEPVGRTPDWFAVDGIDELLTGFYNRRGRRLRSETPRTIVVTAESDEGPVSWLVHIGPDGPTSRKVEGLEDTEGKPDCAVRGPAHEVYLALWNRGSLTDLTVTGDPDVLTLWTEKAKVRWS